MKSILDPSFHYTPSAQTDLRKTFARIRREQAKAKAAEAAKSKEHAPVPFVRLPRKAVKS